MYEARQNKEKVSRRIETVGGARQKVKMENEFDRLIKMGIQLGRTNQRQNQENTPIQRTIIKNPKFIIHGKELLNDEDNTKITSAATILANTINSDKSFTIFNIIISIEKENGYSWNGNVSSLTGENPAITYINRRHGRRRRRSKTIVICLQRPFVVVATEGQILGMLLHEVGVHSIPTHFRPVYDSREDSFTPVYTERKRNKRNTQSGGYEFQQWPANHPYNDGHRQHDHVMISRIFNPNPTGRAGEYLRTYLNIGRQIQNMQLRSSQDIIKDMTHMFLVDIARIVATDDMRMPISKHLLAFNDLYQEGYRRILQPLRNNDPWIPDRVPYATLFGLGVSLSSMLYRARKEKERNG